MLRFPVDEDAILRRVQIIGGKLAGVSGHIEALTDEPHPSSVLVQLDGSEANVWIEVDHLEEEPLTVTTARPKGCPHCLRETIEDDGSVYIEQGAYDDHNSYEAEGDAPRYRCTSDDCGKTFVVW